MEIFAFSLSLQSRSSFDVENKFVLPSVSLNDGLSATNPFVGFSLNSGYYFVVKSC